jgi:flagellar assembly protein FliH
MTSLIRGAGLGRGVHRLRRLGEADPGPAPLSNDLADAKVRSITPEVDPLQALTASVEDERIAWRKAAAHELAEATARAVEEGHANGLSQGTAKAAEAARSKLRRLDTLIGQLGQAFDSKLDDVEDVAVAIAYEAVVKILGTALGTSEGVRAVVAQALAATRQHEKLTVRLAPEDFQLLMQDTEAQILESSGVELRPDEQVEPGGCIVDTGTGRLDARLHTQLLSLRQVLVQARQTRTPQVSA